MIRGIIYKYTSPSGKVYIGQTINEKDRRKHFLIQKLSYGGIKIDTARAKYNPENFKYEILETRFYMTKKAAAKELDILESYYIGFWHYRSTSKGKSLWISINAITENSFKGAYLGFYW